MNWKVSLKSILFCVVLLSSGVAFSQQFKLTRSSEGIELLEGDKKVLFLQVKPKYVDGKYERAGYIHPLYSLQGNSITDDMPKDHPYHRGIFWAWHQFILNDSSIGDGWVSQNISYEPVKVDVDRSKTSASILSKMIWKANVDNKPLDIVLENTTIKVCASTAHYRILDFDIHLAALVDNLKIGGSNDEKGYGGFCLRLKLPKDISFVSEGKIITPQETAVIAGPWMDIKGSLEGLTGQQSGVAVFANIERKMQQPWILRSVTSMQNVPYPGRTPIPLTKKGMELKYRVVVHDDKLSTAEIEKLYQQYVSEKSRYTK